MYRLRIDIVEGFSSEKLVELMPEATSYVVVKHELPKGNPHIHAYMEIDVKEPTLRQRIKRKFDNLKPSDFSIKKCDPNRVNEYVQYMFNTKHGNKSELLNTHNFDDKLLNDLIQAAKKISDDYAATKVKKSKGITIYELAIEINEIYKKSYLAEHSSIKQYRYYLEIAIKVCHKYRKAFEEHLLRRLVTTAITIDSKQGEFTIIRKIIEKEFKDFQI